MNEISEANDLLSSLRFRIGIDTTSICNLRCRQCFHTLYHKRGMKYKQHEMPPELFEKILDELDGQIESLIMSCSAEPFTNSDFGRYLDILRRRKARFEKWLATNGLLLTEDIARKLIEGGLDWMVVSIDGATEKTYNELRAGGRFDRLMAKLDMFNRLKKEMGAERPFLRFNVIISRLNIDELPKFIDLAHEKQVAEVTFQHLVPFMGLELKKETLYYENRRKVREIFDQTRDRAHRLGVSIGDLRGFRNPLQCFGDLLAGMARKLSGRESQNFCHHIWMSMAFNSRGDLFPCFCWFNEPPMGNIGEKSLREIWDGEPYRRLRAELTGEQPVRRHCLNCSHVGKSELDRQSFREQEIDLYQM